MPFRSVTDSPRKINKKRRRQQLKLKHRQRSSFLERRKIPSPKGKHSKLTTMMKQLQEPKRLSLSLSSTTTTNEQHRDVEEGCPTEYARIVQELFHSIDNDVSTTSDEEDGNNTTTSPFPIVCWEDDDEDDNSRRRNGRTLLLDGILRPKGNGDDSCPKNASDLCNDHRSGSSLNDQIMTNRNTEFPNQWGLKRSHKIASQLNLLNVGRNAFESDETSMHYCQNSCWDYGRIKKKRTRK